MSETATPAETAQTAGRAQTLHVREDEIVQHGEDLWQVNKIIDLKSVLATRIDNGDVKVLDIKDLKKPPVGKSPTQPPRPLDGIPQEDWDVARERHKAIEPLLKLPERSRQDVARRAAQVGYNPATLYEWIRRYTAYDDMTALIPHVRGWPKGRHRISKDADAIIEKVIKEYYLQHHRPTVLDTIGEVHGACRKADVDLPSASAIRARISAVPERERLRERGYREEARAKYHPSPGHFPNADYPLACIQIDHTKADIILVDDEHRKTIGRPWLTVAIDVHSRVVTGCHLSLDAPSETSVALCVAQSILPKDELLVVRKVDGQWPVWGFPDKIHVDNAGEFRSDSFTKSCESHGMAVEYRPVKRPEYGAHIERLIGTFMNEVHKLPGTTHSSPAKKGDIDPEKTAMLTFSEFEDWLFDFLCNVYHRRTHTGIGIPPLAKWEEGILKGSDGQPPTGLPARPENATEILRDFLPRFERTIQREGVEIDTVWYYGEALAPWIRAKDPDNPKKTRKFIFRRDPRDITKIWFHDPEQKRYFDVPTQEQPFPHTNVWELRDAKRDLKAREEKLVDQAQLVQAVNRIKEKVEAAAARTKQARRKSQRRKEHQRKHAAEAAENAARKAQAPAPAVDPLADLLDEQPEGFGRW